MKHTFILDIYAVLLWICLPLITVILPDEMSESERQSLREYLKGIFNG